MRSTLLPWLFFGPLFGMMGGYILWTFTHWTFAKWAFLGCLIWVVAFGLTAFMANYFKN